MTESSTSTSQTPFSDKFIAIHGSGGVESAKDTIKTGRTVVKVIIGLTAFAALAFLATALTLKPTELPDKVALYGVGSGAVAVGGFLSIKHGLGLNKLINNIEKEGNPQNLLSHDIKKIGANQPGESTHST